MLRLIGFGILLIVTTVIVHAIGTTFWIQVLTWRSVWLRQARLWRSLVALASTALLLLTLHVIEVVLWALAYSALPDVEQLQSIEQAIYFSFITFTTLGYGDITLQGDWQLLSGIEALNGILLVGWSAASFFALIQKLRQVNEHPS